MSFHTDYESWERMTHPENCPCCLALPMPEGMVDVVELPCSWLDAEPVDVLKGTCCVVSKVHAVELYDLTDEQLLGYMKDLAVCARALKKVTDAVKINYEFHGNSAPHLHCHLYPRYMDDPFPGQPIDYRQKKADLYAEGEFDRFVAEMRALLKELTGGTAIVPDAR